MGCGEDSAPASGGGMIPEMNALREWEERYYDYNYCYYLFTIIIISSSSSSSSSMFMIINN